MVGQGGHSVIKLKWSVSATPDKKPNYRQEVADVMRELRIRRIVLNDASPLLRPD